MKVLITGARGFVAPYLASELKAHGHQIILTGREAYDQAKDHYLTADLSQRDEVAALIQLTKPDAVVHLAGISNVSSDRDDRSQLMTASNIDSTRFLCESLHAQTDKTTTFVLVSTGLVYRPHDGPEFKGYHENSPLGPVNDYGWSKLGAEAIAQLFQSENLKTYIVRPFNHIGPGQDERFVCPSLAKKVIRSPDKGTIEVGNLEAERDFCDVRDIVRAYRLLLEIQPQERVFVLGSGVPVQIREVLQYFIDSSGKEIRINVSQDLLRKEHDIVFGIAEKAFEFLNWKPAIPLQVTLEEIYKYFAYKLQQND